MSRQESATVWQLACGAGHGFFSCAFSTPAQLDNHITWFNRCDPAFRVAFTLAHANFQRFFGVWLVRKYSEPYLAAAFQVTVDGYTNSLYLMRRDPAAFKHLQTVVTKVKLVVPRRVSDEYAALHLSVLYAFWH